MDRAPSHSPPSIAAGIAEAAAGWAADPIRPRAAAETLAFWDRLLDEWCGAEDMPLLVRKFRDNRGHEVRHASGRVIVPCDNTPAHWSLTMAIAGVCPSLADVRTALSSNKLPVAMAFTAVERAAAKYTCTRGTLRNPNELGWKVAHIDDVGLGYSGPLAALPIEQLQAHFRRFLAPSNMFVVPKQYAGLAETPEFLTTFATLRGSA